MLEREKVWSTAVKADSVLLAPAGAAKMAPADCVAVVDLCEVLLIHHAHRLGKQEGGW